MNKLETSLTFSTMALAYILILTFLLTDLLISPVKSQACTSQKFTNDKQFKHCSDLPQLTSSIHWTYDPSNASLSIAFVAPPEKPDGWIFLGKLPDGWISWAINPTGSGMVGSQSLVAFNDPKAGSMIVKTYNLKGYSDIIQEKLSFDVIDMAAENVGGLMKIFATVKIPATMGTTINQVWQVAALVKEGGCPAKHSFAPANLNAVGKLDLLQGKSTAGPSNSKNKNIHGILNVVSWGIMFPLGIIIARYSKVFPSADPAWFYLHVSCQCGAYVIGVAGWGTGLKLGSHSKGVHHYDHRNIGIALFCLATVQLFALVLRPKKDHKFRWCWNIYHHEMGYSIIILGIINVFKGLDILQPDKKWKNAYVGVIVTLAVIAVFLEVITWIVFLKKRSSNT